MKPESIRKYLKVWIFAATLALASLMQMTISQQQTAEAQTLESYFPGLESTVDQGYYDGYSWGQYDGQNGLGYGHNYPYSESICFVYGWGYYSADAGCVYQYGFSLGYVRGWNAL
jgi:hypothetical protein